MNAAYELFHGEQIWDRRLQSGHGAYDGKSRTGTPAGIIMLAGPIKHWWDENWLTAEHERYVEWRNRVTDTLVAGGYLVYQPHAAFKGTWNEKAQVVNNIVISICDALVVLTPDGVASVGTDEEIYQAKKQSKPIIPVAPPDWPADDEKVCIDLLDQLFAILDS